MTKLKAGAEPESHSLTGVEKVTVLLLALGRPKAAQLLKRMDPDEIRLIARSAEQLPAVSPDELSRLVEEFALVFSGGVNFAGTATEVKSLLTDVMSEGEIAELLAEGTGKVEPVWSKVARVEDDTIRAYLLREHPQTVALILSRLNPSHAARLIGSLPVDMRNVLLVRMIGIKAVDQDALEILEATLREDLITLRSPATGAYSGMADILNRLDKAHLDSALKHLSEVRPADMDAMRGLLFSFDDLSALPPRALTLVFNQVPPERLVLALRGTDYAFQQSALTGLAARARRMIEVELEAPSDASARDIAEARRGIVEVVLKLMAERQIELPAESARASAPLAPSGWGEG